MTRCATALLFSLLVLSVSAFGQLADPTGFCPTPGTVASCTTPTGLAGETIGIGATSFDMLKIGSGTSNTPWYMLIAVPDDIGGAPVFTSTSIFTQSGATADAGQFKPTTSGDIYAFAGLSGDSSMRASNMFGSNELAAFGSVPSFFEIFVYTFKSSFDSNIAYTFKVGGTGLEKGTFLAATDNPGSGGFSTPFTTTGLVNGPGGPGGGGGGGGGGTPVPEPSTIVLLGTVSLVSCTLLRKKARKHA
jgi:hypothetical protein